MWKKVPFILLIVLLSSFTFGAINLQGFEEVGFSCGICEDTFVPYTGANADVDLGNYNLKAKNLTTEHLNINNLDSTDSNDALLNLNIDPSGDKDYLINLETDGSSNFKVGDYGVTSIRGSPPTSSSFYAGSQYQTLSAGIFKGHTTQNVDIFQVLGGNNEKYFVVDNTGDIVILNDLTADNLTANKNAVIGNIDLTGSATNPTIFSNSGNLILGYDGSNYIDMRSGISYLKSSGSWSYAYNNARFYPYDDNSRDLGDSSKRWQDIYGYNGDFATQISSPTYYGDNAYLNYELDIGNNRLYDDYGSLMLVPEYGYICFDEYCNYYIDNSYGYTNLGVDYAYYSDYATTSEDVDGYSASGTPTANTLLPLDSNGDFGLIKSNPKFYLEDNTDNYRFTITKDSDNLSLVNEIITIDVDPYAVKLDGSIYGTLGTNLQIINNGRPWGFWAKDLNASNTGYFWEDTTGYMSIYFQLNGTTTQLVINSNGVLKTFNITNPEEWHSYGFRMLSSTTYVYIDSVYVGSTTGHVPAGFNPYLKEVSKLFSDKDGNNILNATIDEFIWETAYQSSHQTFQSNFYNNGEGNFDFDEGSAWNYHFDEGTGTTVINSGDGGSNTLTFNSTPNWVTGEKALSTSEKEGIVWKHYKSDNFNSSGVIEIGDAQTEKVKVLTDINVSKDLNVEGNFTGNFYYAEGWGTDIGEVNLASAGVYYNVTNFTMGIINGFQFGANGNVSPDISGVYKVTGTWSFSGTANNEYHIAIAKNNIVEDKCHAERVIGTGGDVGSASVSCFLRLEPTDYLNAQIENVDSAGNPSIHNINFNIVRIGN